MNTCRSMAAASTLVAVGLSATPALAMDPPALEPAPPVEAAAPVTDTAVADGAQRCHDHWFAMEGCHDRPWTGPEIVFGLDIGTSKFDESGPFGFNNGIGSVTSAGPAWGVRGGVELLRWLALEAHYVGMYNGVQLSVSPTGSVGYFTTGVDAFARFTLPLPYVHPYLLSGVGYYDYALSGSSTAKAGTVMNSTSQPSIPMGVGVDVPLNWHLSVGLEATYHFSIGESYSAVTTNKIDGGDASAFSAVMRFRL
ncbi:MAG TPA: outer membrane beta-barrel protein [Polyangiaceae bacterium]